LPLTNAESVMAAVGGAEPAMSQKWGKGWSLLVAALALALLGGCAKPDWIERTLVTADVTGTWSGSSNKGASYQFELVQSGPGVKGTEKRRGGGISATGGSGMLFWSGPVEGTVSGDVFRFSVTSADSVTRGELRVNGDEMSGEISDGFGVSSITLRRVGAPPSSTPPKP